jgi:hypothetical protein
LKTHPSAELLLSGFAEHTWQAAVRPWLLGSRGSLARSLLVAPSRGHTHALKQRCVVEGVRLIGTEFLTPSLARCKRSTPPAPQRVVCALLLRALLDARVAALDPADPSLGVLRSLASDIDGALDSFDELVGAGLSAAHFPRPELRELFGAMEAWFEGHGYKFAPRCDAADWAEPADPAPAADRLLILAGGPENWPEFLGLAALAARCTSVRVVAASPQFRGPGAADEAWVRQWEAILGVEAGQIDLPEPAQGCGAVGELWGGPGGSAERAEALIGGSRPDEAALAAEAVASLVAAGSDNVAVILRGPGPAHSRLLRMLAARGIAFADLVGETGAPPLEVRVRRAVAEFLERGCRMEEFLALWSLLRADNLVSIGLRRARRVCQDLYDDTQSSQLAPLADRLKGSDGEDAREVARILAFLLPAWPAKIVPAEALSRFESACAALSAGGAAPGWGALVEFASKHPGAVPSAAILGAIRASLPERAPVPSAPGRGVFARVTLTTIRRAAGLPWSDVVLAEANSGSWPAAREPGVWFPESARAGLALGPERAALTLPGRDAAADLERGLYRALARDTSGRLYFTAACHGEDDPELALVGNPWLERVLFSKGVLPGAGDGGLQALAVAAPGPVREEARAPGAWRGIWVRRRDPSAPFDEFFLGGPSGKAPARMSATDIERGVEDPAALWFKAVLRVQRVEWRPFARTPGRALGEVVHDVLAAALRGTPAEEHFTNMPDQASAGAALERELSAARSRWPSNALWDSFHIHVSSVARSLLASVYALGKAPFIAIEAAMPAGASVPVGQGRMLGVGGKMDVVLSDRPGWRGAHVAVVDFKTGGDPRLSARRMASTGASLQLGVYLAAARSLGAGGAVWMLKPGERPAGLEMSELDEACVKLAIIGRHLETGLYGARTRDRTDYTHAFEWPLACAPVPGSVLEAKFALTFGADTEPEGAPGE